MRRLYVLPKSVWAGKIQTGTAPGEDGKNLPVMMDMVSMFHPTIGSHYMELSNGMILMCTSFSHSERAEDLFHAHPEVAILPHPAIDGRKTLKDHIHIEGDEQSPNAPYKFRKEHMEALKGHVTLGFVETDTVLDLARKAATIHPEIKFRNVL